MSNPVQIDAPEGASYLDITREFDFPVAAVYRAHADGDLYQQWCGPHDHEVDVTEFDVRPGGRYAFSSRSPEGSYAFQGVFHTVKEDELQIRTFEYLGVPDVVSLETARFEDLGDGRSRIVARSVFPTVEARDGMIDSGMEHGVTEGYERLDDILATDGAPAAA